MSIGISTEHRELAAEVARWAGTLDAPAAVRDAEQDPDATFATAWKAVTEMGLASIGVPERLGGGGGTLLDVAVALEACAAHLVPGPLLPTAVAAHALAGGPEADDVVATLPLGGGVALGLDGQVWGAPGAGHVLLVTPDGCVLAPAAAVPVEAGLGVDLSTRVGRLGAAEVRTLPGTVALEVDPAVVRRTAVTLAAAEAAGVARWCLATAVDYAKTREQFGNPIGAFQAIKHLCAEMLERA
ncbi:MAG: acyl-CoA dehydrogenase family protein, partial [Marmoricola sp.]